MSAPGSTGLDRRTAAVLCYSAWWITGLVFLIAEREDRVVRVHAAQSIVCFGAVSLLLMALAAVSALSLLVSAGVYPFAQRISELVWLGGAALWLVCMLRAWRGDDWRLPVVSGLAERMAGERDA